MSLILGGWGHQGGGWGLGSHHAQRPGCQVSGRGPCVLSWSWRHSGGRALAPSLAPLRSSNAHPFLTRAREELPAPRVTR